MKFKLFFSASFLLLSLITISAPEKANAQSCNPYLQSLSGQSSVNGISKTYPSYGALDGVNGMTHRGSGYWSDGGNNSLRISAIFARRPNAEGSLVGSCEGYMQASGAHTYSPSSITSGTTSVSVTGHYQLCSYISGCGGTHSPSGSIPLAIVPVNEPEPEPEPTVGPAPNLAVGVRCTTDRLKYQFILTWQSGAHADYEAYYAMESDPWTKFWTRGPIQPSSNPVSAGSQPPRIQLDLAAPANTLFNFRLVAITDTGQELFSNVVSLKPGRICGPEPQPTLPGPFTVGGTYECFMGNARITLNWRPSAGASNYTVEEVGSPLGPTTFANASYISRLIPGQPARVISFNVYANNEAGRTLANDGALVQIAIDCPVPPPPAGNFSFNVSITCNGTTPIARVSWNRAPNAYSYEFLQYNRTDELSRSGNLTSETFSHQFTMRGAVGSLEYYFGSVKSSPESGGSLTFATPVASDGQTISKYHGGLAGSIEVAVPNCNLPLPGVFTATASEACVSEKPRITVSWTSSSNTNQYLIRKKVGNTETVISNGTTSTYIYDLDVQPGITYSYVVYALNTVGQRQAITNEINPKNCVTPTPTTPQVANINFKGEASCTIGNSLISTAFAQANQNISTIVLRWDDVAPSSGESAHYSVIRDGEIIFSGTDIFGFRDTEVLQDQSYDYVIRYTISGSDYIIPPRISDSINVKAPSCVQKPGSFTVNATTSCSTEKKPVVNVTWQPSSQASQYTLYRVIEGASQAVVGRGIAGPLSYSDEGPSSGRQISYYVKASNISGATDSNTVEVTARDDCDPDLNAETVLSVEKPIYEVGEQVRFTLLNKGPDAIEFRSAAPFDISKENTKIFSPVSAQVVKILTTNNTDSWVWNQIDNDDDQVQIGEYSVTVYYYLNNEQQNKTATFKIIKNDIEDPEPDPGIDLTVIPQKGYAPLEVVATSLVDGDEYNWNFGDGTIIKDGDKTEKHVYGSPGKYTVTLTIGEKSASKYVEVEERSEPLKEFDFKVTPDRGKAPLEVTGTIITACSEEISWDWGDGNKTENGKISEKHTYADPGIYTIVASCGDDFGSRDVVVTDIDTTTSVEDFDFKVTPDSGDAPLEVTGTILSNCADPITWNWGDGTIMDNANSTETHIYTEPGTFIVKASCGDASGTTIVRVADKTTGLVPATNGQLNPPDSDGELPETGIPIFNILKPLWNWITAIL